ncbi:MAG: hypothetical protein MJ168_03645 [Clostridia bacterium]|nr:hypothetical protein [Clostridia bacterium]
MKKIISVLLSLILALSVSITVFAKSTDGKCDCGYVPVIYVTGFAQTDLVANPGTEDEYHVFIPEAKTLVTCVLHLVMPIVRLCITKDYDTFAYSLAGVVDELFADAACDADGVPLNPNVDIEFRDEPTAMHTAYTFNSFRYDWREDIFDIAAELNDFIEETKKLTGHDKVALKAESMGGAVAMTYIYEYGSDSVDTLVMQSAAYRGITLMGSLFKGDINIKGDSVLDYIGNFLEGNRADMMLYRALLMSVGKLVINPLSSFLDGLFDKVGDALYAESLKHTIGWIPGVWAFVPFEDYEEAKAYILDEDVNAKLIEKLDKYQYNVAANTKELLDDAIADGMKLCIVSHYGKAGVPVNTYDKYQSDFLIDTKRTSFGATCADFGTAFEDGYVQQIDDGHNHISCDCQVDASTCTYPEYTWFIKDMVHTWYTRGYMKFVYDLIYSDEQPTIETFSQYPQFLYNNQETGTLDILSAENQNTRKTDIDVKGIAELIKDKVEKK